MGCFSFLCLETGEPINSSSFQGDQVALFLLKEGKCIEYMVGNYNSYGCVFKAGGLEAFEWDMPWPNVCDLMFGDDPGDGIAAIKLEYWSGEFPTMASLDDPDQGWGDMTNYQEYAIPYHTVISADNTLITTGTSTITFGKPTIFTERPDDASSFEL